MTVLSEFELRAWQTRGNADKHLPEMVLKVALHQIEEKKITPKHIIVVYVEDDGEGGDLVSMLQAGCFSELGTEGALGRAVKLSQQSS